MRTSTWLARFLAIGSVSEGALALALFVDSPRVASILRQSGLDAAGEIVARIAAGGLLALAIACWRARTTPMAPAGRGVAWALLAYNLVAGRGQEPTLVARVYLADLVFAGMTAARNRGR